MDEKIVLTRQQILSSALKVSKCRSLVKRRFQSLGLKYADSQEVRDRLTMIEKTRFIIWENFVRATISIPYSPWQIPCLSFSF